MDEREKHLAPSSNTQAQASRRTGSRRPSPRGSLRGGRVPRGATPQAAGHAGRRSIALESRRRAGALLASAALVVSQALSFVSLTPVVAPASEQSTLTVTAAGAYSEFGDINESYDSLHWFSVEGSEDGIAFCGDKNLTSAAVGSTFTNPTSANAATDWIMYHGWSPTNQQAYGLSSSRFRFATQYVTWLAMPNSSSNDHDWAWEEIGNTYADVREAIQQMVSEMDAYVAAGGGGVEAGCALVWPSPDGVAQSLVTRRIPTGELKVQKVSGATQVTEDNPCYSREGALYKVYTLDASGNETFVTSLKTLADGSSEPVSLDAGTYYVWEASASEGYLPCAGGDGAVSINGYWYHEVTVSSGKTTTFVCKEPPASDVVTMLLAKYDSDREYGKKNAPSGSATLAGAEFTVDYYATLAYDGLDALVASGEKPTRTWTFATDSTGRANFDDKSFVRGSALYHDANGNACIPRGCVVIRETKAPDGYKISEEASFQKIQETPTTSTTFNAPTFAEDAVRGGVAVTKIDHDRDESVAQGDATLEGAKITIYNRSGAPVLVDGSWYENNKPVLTLTTNKKGAASSDAHALPYGTYEARETQAPKGYLLNEKWSVKFAIQQDGAMSELPALADTPLRGGLSVTKIDHDLKEGCAQGDATLEGAKIAVRNDSGNAVFVNDVLYQPGDVVMTLKTGNDGAASTGDDALPYGTYTLFELEAPTGYEKNTAWTKTVKVRSNKTVVSGGVFDDLVHRGGVKVRKYDAEHAGGAQGDATLAGTKIAIKNASEHDVFVDGKRYKSGEDVLTLVTDKNGSAATGDNALPFGTYEAREIDPPTGYSLNGTWKQTFSIKAAGQVADLTTGDTALKDDAIRGGVKVRKSDRELAESQPVGGATLEGAEISIYNRSAGEVVVEGKTYQPGDVVKVIATDKEGLATTDCDTLPYGTYELRETKPPAGYKLNADWSATVKIRENGRIYNLTSDDVAVFDQAIRGDLSLVKADEDSQSRMAGIAFRLTSQTTGETHVIVTDENGMASTAASWNPHSQNTNANDWALNSTDDQQVIDSTTLDASAGTWFAGTSERSTLPDDSLGALPYDTYDLAELRCSANEGHRLVSTTVRISRDATRLDLGTFDNKPVWIGTTLTSGAGGKIVPAGQKAELVDEVRYENLAVGGVYTLSGELHETDEMGNDLGVVAETTSEFTARLQSDSVPVVFQLESAPVEGHKLVAFEVLRQGDDELTRHEDLTDEGQTVTTITPDEPPTPEPKEPAISTTLTYGKGEKVAPAAEKVELTDNVNYENLVVGETYRLLGELHEIDAEENDLGVVATAETELAPKAAAGQVQVTFSLSTVPVAGHKLVAFEKLHKDEDVVASHEDLSDEGQTVAVENPVTPTPPSVIPKTGDPLPASALATGAAGGLAIFGWMATRRRR